MSLAGKFLAFDAAGNPIGSSGTGADAGLREDLAGPDGASLVANQLPEGANLRLQTVSEFMEGGYLMPSQFEGTAEQRFLRAIIEAGTTRNDGLGQSVQIPRGELNLTATFNLQNRATVAGVNKRGSILKADVAFNGSYMATVVNGAGSTFDNCLRDLTLNCNDVPGLSGVESRAWQEGGGLQRLLVQKFRNNGIYYLHGFGGASTLLIDGAEIFGSGAGLNDHKPGFGALAGLHVAPIAADGGFLIHVTNTTICGDAYEDPPGTIIHVPMVNGIKIERDSLHCHVVHFEECGTGIELDGAGDSVLIGVTGSTTVPTLVRIKKTFTGTLSMIGCSLQGSTDLVVDERVGGLGTISYDTDVKIRQAPEIALGSNVAGGNFNGNLVTPNINYSFGVSSIVKGTAGVYTVNLSVPGTSSNSFAVFASTIAPGGVVTCRLIGMNSVELTNYNAAGSPSDAIEINFLVVRVA